MSLQYVECSGKLNLALNKTPTHSMELDSIEKGQKEEVMKGFILSNQLEEMARGYMNIEKLLETERYNSDRQKEMINVLINDL